MFCFGCIKTYPPLTQPSAGIDTVRHGWISILMKNCLPIVLSLKSHVPRIGWRMFKGKLQENSIFGSSNPTFLDSSRFLPSSTVIYDPTAAAGGKTRTVSKDARWREFRQLTDRVMLATACYCNRCEDGTVYDNGVANRVTIAIVVFFGVTEVIFPAPDH